MDTTMYECMWLSQAKVDSVKQKALRYQKGRGSCVLFILDFSESMRGEPLRQMKRGVGAILEEFDDQPDLDENVSVIVFGQETKFLHYYSNQYSTIKQSIEEVECGGPSPLTAAFLLALGGLYEGAAHTSRIGDFHLNPRVVLFTDGKLTDFKNLEATENEMDLMPNEHILAPLSAITQKIGRDHPIFCFPVGENPNYPLLLTISGVSQGGKVLEIHEAKCFGRYTLHYKSADLISKVTNKNDIEREALRSVADNVLFRHTYDEDDLDTIYEIIQNKEGIMETQQRVEDDDDHWYKEKYSTIPRLGTRVRRGPHWSYRNQDSEGIGTLVGHGDKVGIVLVEWDNGCRGVYKYGIGNTYDIVVCEEPRIPKEGFVAVGCLVKRGPDWKWGDQDGGEEAIGTCYRVMDNATVYVRWPCGRMSNYRFGYDGKYDIELCDPLSQKVMKAVREQWRASKKPDSENDYRCTSNDLKGSSEIQDIRTNVTKQNSGVKTEYAGNTTSRSKESNQIQRTVSREKRDAQTQNGIGPTMIQREQVTCMDRANVTDKQTEHSSTAVSVDDLETDEGQDTGPEGNSVDSIFGYPEHTRPSSPNEYQNSFSVNSFSPVKNFVANKGKPRINALTINSINKNTDKNPELRLTGTNENSIYLESNVAHISQKHSSNKNFKSEPAIVSRDLSWQWRDNNGVWVNYSDHVNNLINYRLRQRPMATVLINYNDESFRIVASKMIQINTKTKERHDIRCRNTSCEY
ncbi:uncharacterized protein LOC134264902 [Saccostrea cucullata]|uniref:uncharacterized protein LOC134264902 n=1 Tax=Saccostrea cuccullata TaxID=36930 RepID=UPI002ED1A9B8